MGRLLQYHSRVVFQIEFRGIQSRAPPNGQKNIEELQNSHILSLI